MLHPDKMVSLSPKFISLLAVVYVVFVVVSGSSRKSFSQTRDLSIVEGVIRDSQGARISGASVLLTSSQGGNALRTVSGPTGQYSFRGLPIADMYSLVVTAPSFKDSEPVRVVLRAGNAATVNVTLGVAGDKSEVVVYGSAGGIQTSSDEVSTRLDNLKIETTSILNNRATSLVLLDSSVRPAYTTGDLFTNETLFVVNGGGRRQTTWSIDNQNANDSWGRQTIFTTVPLTAIQEFKLVTDAMPAEYGWTSGSAVNIITKSGTNRWHGDLLGTGRPGFSEASAPLSTTKAENTLAQGSANISGPVIRGKTWIDLAGEYTSQTRAAVITSPLAPGTFFDGQFNQTLFVARIDHQLATNNRFTIRTLGDRFTDTNPADAVSGATLPMAARTFERNTYGFNLTDVATLTPNAINELRLQFLLGSPITKFSPVIYGPQIYVTGYYTYGDSRSADLTNHQYQSADTFSHAFYRHVLKAGFDVSHSSSGGYGQEFGSGYVQGRFQVNTLYATLPVSQVMTMNPGAIPLGQPAGAPPLVSTYAQAFGNLNYNVREVLTGIFVQDDWRVTPNLTLNLGARYEEQTFTGDNNNIAPRLGLAWRVPIVRSMSVRTGYGIFFSEIRANQAAGYALGDPRGIFSFSASPDQCGFPTSFTPWATVQDLLASSGCSSSGSPVVPIRTITVNTGQASYLNQYLDVANLRSYPAHLLNPYTHQWNLGGDLDLGGNWLLSVDYIGTRGVKLERAIELNPAAQFVRTSPGQVRSTAAANATRPVRRSTPCTIGSSDFDSEIANCRNNYSSVQALSNAGDSYYNGATVKVQRQLNAHSSALLTYTYSHVINTFEQDGAGSSPNDWNSVAEGERSSGSLDQRHRAVFSGWYELPFRFTLTGAAQISSGFPFNSLTGVDNDGDGSSSDRPVIHGAVVGRNTGRGTAIYTFDTALQKIFTVHERMNISLRAEAFNLFNHPNYFGRNTAYGNAASPGPLYGAPIGGISNTGPGRQMQLLMRVTF